MASNIVMAIVIFVLIALSSFFSATETAFSFVNKIRIQKKSEDGNKKATTALFVIENFDKALTTILICNNVVNLSCSSLATVLCMALFGDYGSAIATGATTLLYSHSVRCFLNVWLKKIATAFLLKQQA